MSALLASSAGVQWAAFGGAAVLLLAGPDKCREVIHSWMGSLVDSSDRRHGETNHSNNNSALDRAASSIIIHTGGDRLNGGSGGNGGSLLTSIVTYTLGAGCVWVSYSVLSNALPAYIGNLLPVTRKIFDQTAKNLATSLVNVKDLLGKQILNVMKKQDDLGEQLDSTHRDVNIILDDLKFVRTDLASVVESVDRCEASVEASQRLQSYTARGVKLLVAAVGTVLPRDCDQQMLRELEHYARDGEVFRRQLERSVMVSSSTTTLQQQPQQQQQQQTPPENEHPRQQLARQTTPPQLETRSDYEFLSMFRDDRLVVPQQG